MDKKPLRVLFSMRNFWYVRIFEPVIRALAARGHSIHLLAEHDPDPVLEWTNAATALANDCPNVTIGYARRSIDDPWLDLRVMVRLGRDYVRFLRPQYAATPILAKRARARVPAGIVEFAERGAVARTAMTGALRAAERAIPEDPEIAAAVAAHRPDLVLVTPLLDLGSDQHDVVRIARRLGIPTALCVGSWDHLSSKALIREAPDRVFVWNETQKREAVDLHHVPADRVVVTGAQCFDQWFDRQPTRPRAEFCRAVGLDPSKPYILYVCSALFEGSPSEAAFVERWIAAVRASSDPELRDAGILIRPHPKRGFEWDAIDVAAFPNVSLWPPRAAAPMDAVTKADYFDSMFHSAAVVGLNTSALIEAGIAGRRVHAILMPEFNENQEGTLHFHYLIDGGLLRVSRELTAHAAQLGESLRASGAGDHPNRAFIESFIRPHGVTVPATPLFVDAVEQLASLHPVPGREPIWISPLRAAMRPLARRTLGTFAEHESRERRYRDKEVAKAERVANLEAQRAAEKARLLEERRRQREEAALERKERVRTERLALKREASRARKASKPMQILFLGRHYTYFRNFESVLRGLAANGHTIHLAVERDETFGGLAMVQALAAEFPSITYGEAPGRADDDWSWTVNRLRLGLDYLRYQHPVFDTASKLRDRSRDRTPGAFVALGRGVRAAGGWSRRLASGVVRRVERSVPEDPAIREYLEAQRPDVVLLTPLIDLGSSQIEYLRAARALRIPTGLCVWSWDHLSSKALIRDAPDRVFVWNPTQKREAIELHGVPAHRIVVTGAQCFDQWFDRRPSRDRETFCRQVGLPSSPPYVLWVCSALFQGSPVEAQFVLAWIRALRASGSPRLAAAPILVRPHPSRLAEWEGVDLSGLNAVVWGGNPVDAQSRADYFDTLYHSAAVVGINTSAFIEAGIVGRPVHTIVVPEMADNQTGTVHFNYLLNAGGGLLDVAHSLDEHVARLDASLARGDGGVKPFVREFVRPNGLDVAATPLFVEQIESMGALKAAAPKANPLARVWREIATRIAGTRDDERYEPWTLSEREVNSLGRLRGAREVKAQQRAEARRVSESEREARRAAEQRERAETLARKSAEKAKHLAEKRARVDAQRASAQAAEKRRA